MKSYPTKFKSFLRKIVQMGTLQKLQNSIQTLIIFWPVYPIHTNSLFSILNTRDQSISTVRTEILCDLIRMILTMNSFEFNNTFYIQTHGTAMGTRMAPSYANLFLAKFETDALSHAPHQPHTWWRFIDDIFMIWTHTEDELRTFITYLNNIHPTIKFTSSHSATSISFLDVKVSLDQFG